MEEEIMSIGAEQKVIFNRLRLFIDYYLLRNKTDRKQLTDFVSQQISMYARVCGPNIRPIVVERRLTSDELHAKFIASNSTSDMKLKMPRQYKNHADNNQIISHNENDDTKDLNGDDCNTESEVMEVLVSPEEMSVPIETNELPLPANQKQHQKNHRKQESLLKPKTERISLSNEEIAVATLPASTECTEKPSTSPQEAINLSRLKLKQALFKAKNDQNASDKNRVKAKSPSPKIVGCISNESKPITISSSSQSSSSSEDIFETIDWSSENAAPSVLNKEPFLRYFGLYTHTYSEYLTKRRTARKRRNCTSTEHRDFHYGRLDLFEKQYANKRNIRQFLYSPPATRAKNQRRTASDAEAPAIAINTVATNNNVTSRGTKSNASSSSTSSLSTLSNGVPAGKVCVTCFKRSKFIQTPSLSSNK